MLSHRQPRFLLLLEDQIDQPVIECHIDCGHCYGNDCDHDDLSFGKAFNHRPKVRHAHIVINYYTGIFFESYLFRKFNEVPKGQNQAQNDHDIQQHVNHSLLYIVELLLISLVYNQKKKKLQRKNKHLSRHLFLPLYHFIQRRINEYDINKRKDNLCII